MAYRLTEEQRQLRNRVREFGNEHIEPVARHFDETGDYPRDLLSKAADEGVIGTIIPEEYGGPGFDIVSSAIVTEEMWRADTNLGWTLGLTGFPTNVYVISNYADEWVREQWFPDIARGEKIDGIAVSEPNHGSNVAGIETYAKRDGNEWVLNGEKKWIGNAPIADLLLVFAKTDLDAGHSGISAFIIPTETEGLDTESLDERLGGKSAPVGRVFLEDVRIPEDHLIGEEGDGFYYFMEALDYGRITVAAQAVGAAGAALDAAQEYAQNREQFDQPISNFQAIRHKIADMATTLSASRHLLYRAATAVRDNEDEAGHLASQAKLFASEHATEIIDEALQIHGGNGYLNQYHVERYLRDARVTRIYEGTSEIQRNIIADNLLESE